MQERKQIDMETKNSRQNGLHMPALRKQVLNCLFLPVTEISCVTLNE